MKKPDGRSIESLLYISTSTLDPDTVDTAVKTLVDDAVVRNRALGMTGALMFTGTHFVQVIEGEVEVIDRQLRKLCADPRHRDLLVIERRAIAARRFSAWSMAYAGQSRFIGRQINRVLLHPTPNEMRRAAGWLSDIMLEFVAR